MLVDAVSICHALQQLKRDSGKKTKVCSIGYPDMLFNVIDLKNILLKEMYDVSFVENLREALYKSDFMSRPSSEVYVEPESFFEALGCSIDVLDIVSHRGVEILADLNQPGSTRRFSEQYDFVIDNGSLEHCFNIGEAMINAARLVRSGGVVMHMSPISMINHGFFNLCPTFFCDFYSANGFRRTELYARGHVTGKRFEIHPYKRFKINGEEATMTFLAKREVKGSSVLNKLRRNNFVYPTQYKYKSLIEAAKPL